MIFDSHAHYDDKQFEADRHELLSSMVENRIEKIVNVGATIEASKETLELAAEYSHVYAAIGVHPSEIDCLDEEGLSWLEAQTGNPKVVAIGEIGLDYYWEKDPLQQEKQKEWFIRQLDLARKVDLPVIIHSRDAAEATMEIMKEHGQDLQGVIHCYSYSKEMAKEYVKMGYYIGIGGVVTFKNAKKLKEVALEIPLEKIVIETDCPYLSPEPNRGKRNSSLNLPYVVAEIARLKEVTEEEVEQVTYENAMKLYRITE